MSRLGAFLLPWRLYVRSRPLNDSHLQREYSYAIMFNDSADLDFTSQHQMLPLDQKTSCLQPGAVGGILPCVAMLGSAPSQRSQDHYRPSVLPQSHSWRRACSRLLGKPGNKVYVTLYMYIVKNTNLPLTGSAILASHLSQGTPTQWTSTSAPTL